MTTDRLGDECSADPGARPGWPMFTAANMLHVSADAVLVDDAHSPLPYDAYGRSRHGGAQDVQPRTICVCVEDFGMHPGINDAALRLASMARAHAIGCRVGGGHWAAWRRPLRRLDAHGIDLGLQVDLTEHPLLPRTNHSLGQLVAGTYGRWINRANLRSEICAQLDAFEKAIGHAPTFVGGHQHVHQLPVVRSELLDEIEDRYGAFRPWLLSSVRSGAVSGAPSGDWRERLKHWSIEQFGAARSTALAHRRGFPQNRHLLGLYGFLGGTRQSLELLNTWLQGAVDGDLLVCHPSTRIHGDDASLQARADEYDVLSGDAFGRLLDATGITSWPMSQIISGHTLL